MVQNRPFSGNTWALGAALIVPALKQVYVTAGRRAGASGLRKPRVPQESQPVGMRLTGQQLRGTLVDSTGVLAA